MSTQATQIALFGTGPLACGVAQAMTRAGVAVHIYAPEAEERAALRAQLPKATLHTELAEVIGAADSHFFAVPAGDLPELARAYGAHAQPDHFAYLACRGTGPQLELPHALIHDHSPVRRIGVIGGPVDLEQLQRGRPIHLILATRFDEVSRRAEAALKELPVTLHRSRDLVGVQLAGAMANAATLMVGAAAQLGFGESERAVILVHGLAEARQLGLALGAAAGTFSGLAGVGELIPRRVELMERHRQFGAALAKGKPEEQAQVAVGGHVEGVMTARAAAQIAPKLGLQLPLMQAILRLLDGDGPPAEAVEAVLESPIPLHS